MGLQNEIIDCSWFQINNPVLVENFVIWPHHSRLSEKHYNFQSFHETNERVDPSLVQLPLGSNKNVTCVHCLSLLVL